MRRPTARLAHLVGGCLLLSGRVVAQGTYLPGGVRGSVYDSLITSAPLVGAEIWVEGTNRTTSTDAGGQFELADLPPGVWRLSFSHPVLDSIGLSTPEARIDTRTHPAEVRFAIPGPSRAHRTLCPHDPLRATGAIIAPSIRLLPPWPLPSTTQP